MSNTHKGVGRASQATKPDLWYFDQLPASARTALANSDHNWSSAWLFNAWRKAKPGYKTGQACAKRVQDADRKARSNHKGAR